MKTLRNLPLQLLTICLTTLFITSPLILPAQDADDNQKPGLTYSKYPSRFSSSTNPLTPNPMLMLHFNAPVDSKTAKEYFRFWDKTGKRSFPSVTKKPTLKEFLSFKPNVPEKDRKNLSLDEYLLVKPKTALPENSTWYLWIKKGMNSKNGSHEFAKEKVDYLGQLNSFVVNNITPGIAYDSPRMIRISLNKNRLHKKFRKEDFPKHISIKPEPDGFAIKERYNGFDLAGDFEYDRPYTVTVKPGLIANDTTQLKQQFSEKIIFQPKEGFISIPMFSTTQSASGKRKFSVNTGNLKGLRTQVKQLDGDSLIYALRGYNKEYEGWGDELKTPFNLAPGKQIYDQFRKRKVGLDKTEKIPLNWDALSGGQALGAYYLCVEGDSDTVDDRAFGAQAIVQLTDIGLAWKVSEAETVIYAFSMEKGTPLAGVDINLLDDNATSVAKVTSDKDGIARLSSKDYGDEKASWLDAKFEGDRHAISFSESLNTVSLWNFNIEHRYDELVDGERRTLLFTDRPIYKPGEKVFVKAISRLINTERLLPGGGGNAKLRVFDPRNRKILERDVTLNANGSFDDSFRLPEGGLGWYDVRLDFNKPPGKDDDENDGRDWRLITTHSFQVEEYRVNTFEVSLDAPAEFNSSEQIQVPVSAKYYMGKPLSKSIMNWNVRASTSYPDVRGFDEFHFGVRSRVAEDYEAFSKNDTVHLTGDGKATIALELPAQTGNPFPRRVSVHAEVIDANQQTVSNSTNFTVHSSDYYLGIQSPDGVYRAGDTVPFSLATVAANGDVYTKPVEVTIRAEKEIYNTVKVRGANGKITTRNERSLELVFEEKISLQTTVDPDSGLARVATREIPFLGAGDFVVTVESVDDSGRKVMSSTDFDVIGATEPTWSWYDVVKIDVIPDKDEYSVGDTAKLLVRTPVFGNALITTERGGVRTTHSQLIDQFETLIEVPIQEGDAPNLFASVLIVRGSAESPHKFAGTDYRMGYCQLKVDDPAGKLSVAIDAGKAEYYQPGESVDVAALVTDHKGQPVANAEVTLFAVDEGVLSLTGHKTPNPEEEFHKPFPLAVDTGQSLSDLLPENPEERDFGNKGYVIGGGGLTGGLDPDKIRKDFKPLAFWKGALKTGADGRAVVKFTAPDNLTRFRIMAIVAEGNHFGHGEKPIVINKPLIIEPALPGFSNLTDQIDLTAVLHNNTKVSQEVEIQVNLDDHAVFLSEISGAIPTDLTDGKGEKNRSERFTLGAGATETVRFPVGMTKVGEAKWNWKVVSLTDPKLRDSTESKLPVGYPLPLLRQTKSFTIENEQDLKNILDKFNPRLLDGHGDVSVTLSNSRVIESLDALDYLLKYPYGCVEQTTSSTLPWLSTQRMRKALPGLDKTEAEVTAIVAKGTRRLFTMQTNDGGLAYWPGGNESVLWGSAYGGMAIALAQKNGIALPKDQTEALWKYLSKNLRKSAELTTPYDLSQRCLALYTLALAGKSEPAYHEVLFNKRNQLPEEARALLALAMTEGAADGENLAVIEKRVDTLLNDSNEAPDSNVAWYRSSYRKSAKLLARLRANPDDESIDDLLDELMDLRKPQHGWGSTYSNAWPLLAISAYSELKESDLDPNQVSIKFADKQRSVNFTGDPSSQSLLFDFDGDMRKQPLSLNMKNSGKLYATVNLATRPKMIPLEPENKGLGIQRQYQKVATDGKVGPANDLMVGDLVLVTLKVNIPKDKQAYLAIDDPLPAIFEAVNPTFKSQQTQDVKKDKNVKPLPRLYTNYKELRKERALFFADYSYRAGDYQIQYLARVVAPGNVIAPPAKVEAMYEPEIFGLSGTQQISARPLDLGANRVAAR